MTDAGLPDLEDGAGDPYRAAADTGELGHDEHAEGRPRLARPELGVEAGPVVPLPR